MTQIVWCLTNSNISKNKLCLVLFSPHGKNLQFQASILINWLSICSFNVYPHLFQKCDSLNNLTVRDKHTQGQSNNEKTFPYFHMKSRPCGNLHMICPSREEWTMWQLTQDLPLTWSVDHVATNKRRLKPQMTCEWQIQYCRKTMFPQITKKEQSLLKTNITADSINYWTTSTTPTCPGVGEGAQLVSRSTPRWNLSAVKWVSLEKLISYKW